MSKENVKKFYEELAKDKVLQAKSRAIGKKYEGQKLDEKQTELIYQKELMPLAREAGYDFTLAELKEYAGQSKKPAMREVSEEELACVAGGGCGCVIGGGGNLDGAACACVFGGGGKNKWTGDVCMCPLAGAGPFA
jgi:hypothetical protein